MGDRYSLFYQKRVACAPFWTGIYSEVANAIKEGSAKEPFEVYPVAMPSLATVKPPLASGAIGFFVFKQKDPAQTAWAIEYAKFRNTTDRQREMAVATSQFPTRRSVGDPFAANPKLSEQMKILERMIREYGLADMGYLTGAWETQRSLLLPMFQAALTGQKVPKQALDEFAGALNKALAEKK
jgi:multiple sugar transport system substrate-binding protein